MSVFLNPLKHLPQFSEFCCVNCRQTRLPCIKCVRNILKHVTALLNFLTASEQTHNWKLQDYIRLHSAQIRKILNMLFTILGSLKSTVSVSTVSTALSWTKLNQKKKRSSSVIGIMRHWYTTTRPNDVPGKLNFDRSTANWRRIGMYQQAGRLLANHVQASDRIDLLRLLS